MEKTVQKKLSMVCNNIRLQRLIKNYTQEYMAYELSISQNAFSKIELGVTQPSKKRIFQIAFILEISVIDLVEKTPGITLNSLSHDGDVNISAAG
jgi:transcriptional regulator with XRE-family HTH domain